MDYYLKTISREAFIADLAAIADLSEWEGQYYQDDNLVIDWVGQIPNGQDADGNMIYKPGQHANIRVFDGEIDITGFASTQSIFPETPYRVFA